MCLSPRHVRASGRCRAPPAGVVGVLSSMDPKAHWDGVYRTKPATAVSWYQAQAKTSRDLIASVARDLAAPIIDVGGGASTLIDGLVAFGYRDLTVLDLAGPSLAIAQSRLGPHAASVRWMEADVLTAALPFRHYAVWHDRAVFHFLTERADRQRYVAQARRAIRQGGHIIVATFAPDGPQRCSGLDVMRYTPDAMHAEFGSGFALLDSIREEHHTPSGAVQSFVYCLCRMED